MSTDEYSITPDEKEVLLIDGSPFVIREVAEDVEVPSPVDEGLARVTFITLQT